MSYGVSACCEIFGEYKVTAISPQRTVIRCAHNGMREGHTLKKPFGIFLTILHIQQILCTKCVNGYYSVHKCRSQNKLTTHKRLKSPAHWMFGNRLLRLASNKTSKLRMTGSLGIHRRSMDSPQKWPTTRSVHAMTSWWICYDAFIDNIVRSTLISFKKFSTELKNSSHCYR